MKEVSINHFFKTISQSRAQKNKLPPPLVRVSHSQKKNSQNTPDQPYYQRQAFQDSIINSQFIFDSKISQPPLIKQIQSQSVNQSSLQDHIPLLHSMRTNNSEDVTVSESYQKSRNEYIRISEEENNNSNEHIERDRQTRESDNLLKQIQRKYSLQQLWVKHKSAPEIVSQTLTKNQKSSFYLKYLQQTMIQSHSKKYKNNMDVLSCLLTKLTTYYNKPTSISPQITISSQNIDINLNPPQFSEEKEVRRRELENKIKQKQLLIAQMVKEYDKIAHNYAKSIINIKKGKKSIQEQQQQYDSIQQPQHFQSKVTFNIVRKQTFGVAPSSPNEYSRGSKDFED